MVAMQRFSALLAVLWLAHSALALDPRKALTQYSTSTWTQQQGLPQDTVRAIAQTPDGYLWLGTDEGLARFDGYEFTVFNRDRRNLPANGVTALAAGQDGSLWIGTRNGLTLYREGRFRTYTHKDGIADDLIAGLFIDHSGILWIVAGGNLSRFDGAHFRNFMRQKDLPLLSVRSVAEDRQHNIIVSGNSGVFRLAAGQFTPVLAGALLENDHPSGVLPDRAGNLWIAGIRGLIRLLPDGTAGRYGARQGLPESFGLNTMLEDKGGTVWVGTDRGLTRLAGDRFAAFAEQDSQSAVRSIFEDREGNLWVGTNNGLTEFRDHVFTGYGKREGLPEDEVLALHQDRGGRIWAGFESGIVLLDPPHVRPVPRLPELYVRRFRESADGAILIAAREGLVTVHKDGSISTFIAPDPQNRKTVFDAIEDSSGVLWLALPNGLGQLREGKFTTVIPAGPMFLENSFNVLARGNDGSIWAGTLSDGLWRYNNGQKRLYTTADGLGSNQIRSLYVEGDGTLWIGTLDGGLNVLRNGKVTHFGVGDGLPSNNIRDVTEDGAYLWLSTTRGISKFAKSQLRAAADRRLSTIEPINYGMDDGLRSAQVTEGQRHADGTLWFATSRGIAVYDPSAEEQSVLPPVIHLLEMSIDGRRFPAEGTPQLPPGRGRLQVRFTAIHLRAPDRVRYSYRMSGIDSDWVKADALRAVTYDSLRHGTHEFRIRAEIPGGPSSEGVYYFELLPHYYETAWFRSLALLALAALIWLGYRWRENQVRNRFGLVLEERARLAREVHDTLAQGFAGIASQLDVVEVTMPNNAGAARDALGLAQRMARHSLTEARRSVMDLRAAALEDQDLGVALKSGAQLWTANSGIDVTVDVNGDASALPEEVAHHVFRIAQEAVANAVNHGNPNQIALNLKIEQKTLGLEVADDGCGFDPRDAFKSRHGNFGLIGMRERAERLGGELLLETEPGKGTRLEVLAPIPEAGR
jgi:signal transduction histidine kinase/ligand-binding sensor domain-containing protein